MIVKNESRIIVDTLKNICESFSIASWIISDTGSTDGTQDLIKRFFAMRGLSGELHEDAWVDFGTNRSQVLQYAYKKSDYVLMWDADDRIHGTITLPTKMEADQYAVLFRSGEVQFHRSQLFNNQKRWIYKGVLHEIAECLDGAKTHCVLEGPYYAAANCAGARNSDPEKYAKDALILEKAYHTAIAAKDSIASRYAFYCANTYRDASYTDVSKRIKAIEFYKHTLALDGWAQEKYIACMNLYDQYNANGTPDLGIPYLMESTKYDLTRVECVYRLVKHYACKELMEPAYACYGMIRDWYETDYLNDTLSSRLFARVEEYGFYLPYFMIIVAERKKMYDLGAKLYSIIWTKQMKGINAWFLKNLVHNLQFFVGGFSKNPELLHLFDSWCAMIKEHLVGDHHTILANVRTVLSGKSILSVYYFFSENIGDGMNPLLFNHFLPSPIYKKIQSEKGFVRQIENGYCIFGAGSILGGLPQNATYDIICGSGFIRQEMLVQKPYNFISVRGPLTRQKYLDAGIDCPERYGDLGLLLRYIIPPPLTSCKKYKVGFIPHYIDKDLPAVQRARDKGWKIIDIMQASTPAKFVEEIHTCDLILSSSLHGIILADSYNIPAYHTILSNNVIGGEFKFRDYYASVGRDYFHVSIDEVDKCVPYTVKFNFEEYYNYIKTSLALMSSTE